MSTADIIEIISADIASFAADLDLSTGESDNPTVITAVAATKLQTSIGFYEMLNLVLKDVMIEALAPHGLDADDLLAPVSAPVTADLRSPATTWARGMIAGFNEARTEAKIHAATFSLILAHAHWGTGTARTAAIAYLGGEIPERLVIS